MTGPPELSVVVPSVNGLPIVLECLRALRADAATGVTIEMLVIDRCGEAVRRAIRDEIPEATIVAADRHATIPAMRATAFRQARAAAVAVIEDHVIVSPGWARQLLNALPPDDGVVGGGVRNAAIERLVDRAAFLCEYSHLLPPLQAGRVGALTGNNVVYRRTVLDRYRATIAEGRWEDHLHAAMRRDGIPLVCHPEIVVAHKMHYRLRDYVAQRFLYARVYAGMRSDSRPVTWRLMRAIGSVALPPLLLGRIIRRVLASPADRGDLAPALPLLVCFVGVWAAGEMIGYAAGPADALERVV